MIKIFDLRKDCWDSFFERLNSRLSLGTGDVAGDVGKILNTVKKGGDKALIEYTRIFDGVSLEASMLKVTQDEIDAAYESIDKKLLAIFRKAKENIENFHRKQKGNSWFDAEGDGILLGQLYRAMDTVGVYVPGGTAAYPSSVLMNAIPARVAGVRRIVMATPPGRDNRINPAILVAAREAGVDEIFRVGGAQAIAAMAFGTETVPKVDKIVGPGNIYVATAKRLVYGYCDIDMIAGPSEITVVADNTANPAYVAADLMSQAEHDVLASAILVTTSEKLALEVDREMERQASYLERRDILNASIENYGAAVIVDNLEEAMEVVNRIAPEHLELCVEEPLSLLGLVRNAGAVFLGHYAPEPLGDYFAGPNHVLPTGGTARFFSPLSVDDFIKKSSVIYYTMEALDRVKDDITAFAEAEGLSAHANAIRVRFMEGKAE